MKYPVTPDGRHFVVRGRLWRGKPGSIVSDNGTEFTCNAMLAWCQDNSIAWHFIAPDKPIQNAFVESFNGRMPD